MRFTEPHVLATLQIYCSLTSRGTPENVKNKRKAQRHRRTLPTNQRVEGLKVSSVVDESKNVPCEVSFYFLCTLEVFFFIIIVRVCALLFLLFLVVCVCMFKDVYAYVCMWFVGVWVYGCLHIHTLTYILVFFFVLLSFFPLLDLGSVPLFFLFICVCVFTYVFPYVCM